MTFAPPVIDTRQWAFSRSELMAGLRQYSSDQTLKILDLTAQEIPYQRPGRGRIRGLRALCEANQGQVTFDMVVKESLGVTRAGTASAGWREVSLYRNLVDQLPIDVPSLVSSDPGGDWLVLNLVPGFRSPESWGETEYLMAIDQLARLHDRFWGLAEDLTTYNFLARPLDADLEIYTQAASLGLQRLQDRASESLLSQDQDLLQSLKTLVANIGEIAASLQKQPATLLHGDYWPGNLIVYPPDNLYVIDWQRAAIGPSVLDLRCFIQSSLWFFEKLPVEPALLIERYRETLFQINGWNWNEADFSLAMDHALLWIFISDWSDLLAMIPNSLLLTRHELLHKTWLDPVHAALQRHFLKKEK
jgi:thiamine kinase-like enzyme